MPARQYGGPWRSLRRQALERDGGRCVKCGAPAKEVDHIVEVAAGGEWFDLGNLQSLCQPCHHRKSARFAGERSRLLGSVPPSREW